MRRVDLADADCGIAQTLGVLSDWWTFLLIRDIAGGVTRFDGLQRGLGMSRRALTERLAALVEHGVLRRRPYTDRPPRHDYLLTAKGEGLLPVLVALQEWGDRHLLGDGSLTATAAAGSAEARRLHALVGRQLPEVTLVRHDGAPVPPADPDAWTVLYCFPGAYAPGVQGLPPYWSDIPGAAGCTLESTTYASRAADFAALGARVHGVSTQRPDQLAAFAAHAELPFPLLSDADGRLAAALLLPTFRAAGADRLKRATLLVDPAATVRAVQFPVTDPAGSVDEMLRLVRDHLPDPDHEPAKAQRQPGTRAMERTDRASRVIAAPPAAVYDALLNPEALEAWLPPDGMRGRVERWDPRPGGGFRMVLTYLDATDAPGKTSDATDAVEVGFAELTPPQRVVQRAVFEADDPAYAGVMTMSWQLVQVGAGTEVTVTAADVPAGIDQTDHQTAMASSLSNLASYVEGADRTGT